MSIDPVKVADQYRVRRNAIRLARIRNLLYIAGSISGTSHADYS